MKMNKMMFAVLAATLAGGAWGEAVVNTVQSTNLFGAVKVTGVASNMYVAVPFEGFDGGTRQAKDVISAANLSDGATMLVYDKANDRYDVYVAASGAWTSPAKVTIDAEGKATVEKSDLARGVAAGTGAILERKDTSKPVYVYGQIPASTAASVSFGQGQTLVCVPSTNAMAAVNLNAFTWTGVKATTGHRLKGRAQADYIQFRDAQNRLVKYFYEDGAWGVMPSQAGRLAEFVSDGKALVPAGTAFWFYSPAGGASVKW